jgi:hypothetical protein
VIKRFTWLMIGFLLGVGSSWTITRRLRRVATRYVPTELRDRWNANVRAAVAEGRDAMRAREAAFRDRSVRNTAN